MGEPRDARRLEDRAPGLVAELDPGLAGLASPDGVEPLGAVARPDDPALVARGRANVAGTEQVDQERLPTAARCREGGPRAHDAAADDDEVIRFGSGGAHDSG